MKEPTQKQRSIQELRARRKVKRELLEECPVDSNGRKLCPRCKRLPDFRGLQLAHKKNRGMGGSVVLTKKEDCEILCARCHFGNGDSGHHLREVESEPQWNSGK